MKKMFIAVVSTALIVITVVYPSITNPSQPVAARTGGPSESTCASSSCHSGTADTGPGNVTITFSNPNLTYTPGDTFQVTVKVTDDTKTRWGFEMTNLDNTNSITEGTWINEVNNVSYSKPTSSSFPDRKYVAHKNANTTTSSWTFNWKAPSSNIGDVCFYAAGMAANNNGGTSGDNVYTTKLCIAGSYGTGIAVTDNQTSLFNVVSLVYNNITVEYQLAQNEKFSINLYDVSGRLVQPLYEGTQAEGMQTQTIKLDNNVKSGMYLVNFKSNVQNITRKIFIQK